MPRARIRVNGQWYDIGGMTQEDKTTYDQKMSDNLSAAKAYAEGINATSNQNVANMQASMNNVLTYFDQYSTDGIIYDSEMTSLNGYINTMQLDKTNIDKRYDTIYNNQYLEDSGTSTPKTDLYNAKHDFDSKYSIMYTDLSNALADTRISSTESSIVHNDFNSSQTSLNTLSTALQNAITAIGNKQSALNSAGTPTDGLIGTLSDTVAQHSVSITQNTQSIEAKVSSTSYNNDQMQATWYNFVKSNTPNMFGDIESQTPPTPYSWMIGTLPDGSQGRVLDKKFTAGGTVDLTEWLMPQIKVNPSKPYLIEFWVKALDTNSSLYFGREEYSDDGNGNAVFNDQDGGSYVSENVVATSDQVGKWVKHYAVIPPHDTGAENSHTTPQSSYTPDFDYKFWNGSTAYIKPKVYLTYNVLDTTKDSEMQAWGFGLYEIGSNVNLYAQVETLNKNMTTVQSDIQQNSDSIALRVTSTTYNSDMTNVNNSLNNLDTRVTNVENQQAPYYVEILSSNGSVFKNGDISTILSAHVYNGATEVTDQIDASRFVWSRTSTDSAGDTTWNNAHTPAKSIVITDTDINVRAVFECDILATVTGQVSMQGLSSMTATGQ